MGELPEQGPGALSARTPLPPGTEAVPSHHDDRLCGAGLLESLGGDGPHLRPGPPVSALLPPPPLTLAAEVVLEDAAPSAGAVDMALVSEQTQVLAAPVVDATRGEFA